MMRRWLAVCVVGCMLVEVVGQSRTVTMTETITIPVTETQSLSSEVDCTPWVSAPWFERSCPDHIPVDADAMFCLQKLYPSSSHEGETTLHAVKEDHEEGAPYNLFVLFGTFAVGALMRKLVMDTIIPFTVVMFLCGCVFGLIGRFAGDDSKWADYMKLADMDPHLILYSFLPVLIFESAFAMEIHVFKKVIVQCVLLATPGLLMATAMTGYTARFLNNAIPEIHYDWSIESCFLFGTILSATDPVAVVALLKELGASALISTMIEGESLFNDGTAIVFFNVLIKALEKESCEPVWDSCVDQCHCPEFECTLKDNFLDVLLEFLRVSLGGLGLGLVFGIVAVLSLERVFNDTLTEVTITIVSAYITFFVCEAYAKVSGVLGLVMLGCYISYFRNCISPEVEHTLHHFWEMAVFLINSCIFALAGMIVTLRAISDVDVWDVIYLMLIYIVINIVRALVLFCFLPILYLFEYKLTWKTFLLVAWGGLRGAVGLSLALVLATNENIVPPHVQDKIMFHTAGIVLMTLCINGVTCRFLVSGLKLNAVDLRRKIMMRDRFHQLEDVSLQEIYTLRAEPLYYDCNWKKVAELTDYRLLLPEVMLDPYTRKDESLDIADPNEMWQYEREAARMGYMDTAASSIHRQYGEGKLSPHSVRALGRMVQTATEITPDSKSKKKIINSEGYIIEAYLEPELQKPKLGLRGCSYAGGKNWFAGAFEVGVGYITMHRHSQKVIRQIAERKAANEIIQQCKRTSAQAVDLLGDLVQQDPDLANYARAVRTRHAALSVLHGLRAKLKGMEEEGRMDDQDRGYLKHGIEKQMKAIKRENTSKLDLPQAEDCLQLTTWYSELETPVQERLNQAVVTQTLNSDMERSFLRQLSEERGEPSGKTWSCPGFVVIVTGVVQLRLGRKMFHLGAGFTIGIQSILTSPAMGAERFSEVFAETECTIAFIPKDVILHLLREYPNFQTAIWKACGSTAAYFLMGMDETYKHWRPERIRHVAAGGYCEFILDPSHGDEWEKEKRVRVIAGSIAVLVKGSAWEFTQADKIRFPDMLPPGFKYGTFGHHAVVFYIPEDVWGNANTRALQRWGRLKSKVRSISIWSGLRGPEYGRCALSWALKRTPPSGVLAPSERQSAPTLHLPPAIAQHTRSHPPSPVVGAPVSSVDDLMKGSAPPVSAFTSQFGKNVPVAAPDGAEAIQKEIPKTDWNETWNEQYKRPYFWNKSTGVRVWKEPEELTEYKRLTQKKAAPAAVTPAPESVQASTVTKEDVANIVRTEIRDALQGASPRTNGNYMSFDGYQQGSVSGSGGASGSVVPGSHAVSPSQYSQADAHSLYPYHPPGTAPRVYSAGIGSDFSGSPLPQEQLSPQGFEYSALPQEGDPQYQSPQSYTRFQY